MADYSVWFSWLSLILVLLTIAWVFLHIIHINKGFMPNNKWLNGGYDDDDDDY